MSNQQFVEIIHLIKKSHNNALRAVNAELINLYWNVGKQVSHKLSVANWGEKTVDELANFIQKNHPELKGFNRRGIYRMRQFYETYAEQDLNIKESLRIEFVQNSSLEIVSSPSTQLDDIRKSLLVKLSWTHHRTIFTRCKSPQEIEFYVKTTVKENYSVKELDRQISACAFERTMLGKVAFSPLLKTSYPEVANSFKDSYIFEFLNLSEFHNEEDLQKGLIQQMKNFVLELGKDFTFIGEEYKLQVGNSDFYIDLLFYHRGLQCLVAFELKIHEFKPEYLGQLNFYLEALDRDIKKPNENPSIGVLLCGGQDSEVVEYALSRSLSPAMISEYKTQLPDKKLLQQKFHQIFENTVKSEK